MRDRGRTDGPIFNLSSSNGCGTGALQPLIKADGSPSAAEFGHLNRKYVGCFNCTCLAPRKAPDVVIYRLLLARSMSGLWI
jgi:hypothetical protein